MRILQLCHRVPFPSNDGGSIAMYNLTKAFLANGHTVFMLAINTRKHFVDTAAVEEAFFKTSCFKSIVVDTSVRPMAAFLNLFTGKSYNIERFISHDFNEALIEILQQNQFDVVQMESLFVAPYLETVRKYTTAKIILRAHNIEHIIWERLANSCGSILKKNYLNLLFRRLRKYELAVINQFDGIAAITEQDAKAFAQLGCTRPMVVIPVGIDLESYMIRFNESEATGIFHLGAMDWRPNEEAIRWLIDAVWLPEIVPLNKGLRLYLAGRNMPEWLKKLNIPSITVDGEVPDAKKYLMGKTIMLVPLLSGGGMRVKIAEGMASGNTIISTSIGAEGIPFTTNKDLIIADTPPAFREAILRCASDPILCKEIGTNARLLAEKYFNNTEIGRKLIGFFEEITGKKN